MARRVVYDRVGGPEVLRVEEIDDAAPTRGTVAVEMRAVGVNPIDWKVRSGRRGPAEFSGPRTIGSDGSGIVSETGPGVTGFARGDAVIVQDARDSYASRVIVEQDRLIRKPDGLDWAIAAALGVPWGTAYQALRSLGISEGDLLLLHGGSGSVGQAALQLAHAWGASVVASGSPRNHDRIRELGGIPIAHGDGLAARAGSAAPGPFTAVLVGAGGAAEIEASLQLVADRSRIGTIVLGDRAAEWGIRSWRGGSPVPLTPQESAWRHEGVGIAARMVAEGRADVEIARTFPLEAAGEAQRLSEAGSERGKIVLVP